MKSVPPAPSEWLRILIENALDMILVLDLQGRIKFISPSVEQIVGFRPIEVIGRHYVEFVNPDDATAVAAEFMGLLKEPEVTRHTEARYRHRGGGWRVLQSICRNLRSTPLGGILVNCRDVTERRDAEDALAHSDTRFREMSEHIRDVFYLYDPKANRQLYVSPAYETIWGRSVASHYAAPMSWLDAVHPEDRERVALSVQAVAPSFEFRIVRPDGAIRWIHSRNFPVESGDSLHIAGVAEDITERKQAESLSLKHAEEIQAGLIDCIEALAHALEAKDPYTAGHQHRVALLATAIGKELGLDAERLKGLTLAAELHDVGKIGVPIEVLCRPGKLTAPEFALVKAHVQIGYDILKKIRFPWPIADVVVQHHERLDGSGYPNGLKGDAIVLEARIVAVADVCESMTAHRPYRPALGPEAAIAELQRQRGTGFDPEVVDACVRIVNAGHFIAAPAQGRDQTHPADRSGSKERPLALVAVK